jgi:hypothetical protein
MKILFNGDTETTEISSLKELSNYKDKILDIVKAQYLD